MVKDIGISIYFMWEWWEKHFHNLYPRPQIVCDEELDRLYMGRKKFLYDNFSEFGIGEEIPIMDGKYVNMVLKWGMDFIPFILGAEINCQDAGGYYAQKMNIETIKSLKPIKVADTLAGEWIIRRKEHLQKRYGSAESAMQLEGPTNISVRIRGEEFYMDLMEDEGLARHVLDVVTETISQAYVFLGKEFEIKDLLIANCNTTLLSPQLYEEVILEYDLKLARISDMITGKANSVRMHHCDVPVDNFIDSYRKIPGINFIEASYSSNIQRVCSEMPGTGFSAMISPVDMIQKPFTRLEEELGNAVNNGADEFDVWNIDPSMDISKVIELFKLLKRCCENNGCKADFNCNPFCWDELEWAFPKYQT